MKTVSVMTLDQPTRTGRIYPAEVVQQALERATRRSKFYGSALPGMLGMPRGMEATKVAMDRLSHLVRNLRIEDGQLLGEVQPLDTPSGQTVSELLKKDTVEFRIAGMCSFERGAQRPQRVSDLTIISINAVNPDTAG